MIIVRERKDGVDVGVVIGVRRAMKKEDTIVE